MPSKKPTPKDGSRCPICGNKVALNDTYIYAKTRHGGHAGTVFLHSACYDNEQKQLLSLHNKTNLEVHQ